MRTQTIEQNGFACFVAAANQQQIGFAVAFEIADVMADKRVLFVFGGQRFARYEQIQNGFDGLLRGLVVLVAFAVLLEFVGNFQRVHYHPKSRIKSSTVS